MEDVGHRARDRSPPEKAFAKALRDRGWTYKRTNKARGFNDLVLKPGQKATDPAEDEANPTEAEIDFG
jgi:hypothetical protein